MKDALILALLAVILLMAALERTKPVALIQDVSAKFQNAAAPNCSLPSVPLLQIPVPRINRAPHKPIDGGVA